MHSLRRPKLMTLEEVLDLVPEGSSIAFGGFLLHNKPSAFARALAKRKVANLTLFASPTGAYEADLLIGAGLVRTVYAGLICFEHLGLAPKFRQAAEAGAIEIIECEESLTVGGLLATIQGLPYHPVTSLRGTDIAKVSPLVKRYVSPFGEELLAAPALAPDVAVIHAQQADEFGNVRQFGARFADQIIAKASRTVIVTVDEVISHQEIASTPGQTTIPGNLVDAVVAVPFGAHPCASHLRYIFDEPHLSSYLTAAEASRVDPADGSFDRYLRRFVYEPASHEDYLARLGGPAYLATLRKGWLE